MLIRVHLGDEVKSVSIEHDDLVSGLRKRSFPKSEGVMTTLGGSDPIDPACTVGDAGLTHRAEVQIVGGTCCACWPSLPLSVRHKSTHTTLGVHGRFGSRSNWV